MLPYNHVMDQDLPDDYVLFLLLILLSTIFEYRSATISQYLTSFSLNPKIFVKSSIRSSISDWSRVQYRTLSKEAFRPLILFSSSIVLINLSSKALSAPLYIGKFGSPILRTTGHWDCSSSLKISGQNLLPARLRITDFFTEK